MGDSQLLLLLLLLFLMTGSERRLKSRDVGATKGSVGRCSPETLWGSWHLPLSLSLLYLASCTCANRTWVGKPPPPQKTEGGTRSYGVPGGKHERYVSRGKGGTGALNICA